MTCPRAALGDPADSPPVTRRLCLLVVAALVAGSAAAACAPFHAGAAATVGADRITTSQLRGATQDVLATASAAPPSVTKVDQGQTQQEILGNLISLQILQRLASRYAVSVSARDIGTARDSIVGPILFNLYQGQIPSSLGPAARLTKARQLAAARGIDLDMLAKVEAYRQAVTDAVPVDSRQVRAAYDAEPNHRVVGYRQIVTLGAAANAIAVALKSDPGAIDQIVAAAGTFAAPEMVVLAGAAAPPKVGAVIGPQTTDGSTYTIIVVTQSRTETFADALSPTSPTRAPLQRAAFSKAYPAEAAALGIHVSPRFGSWSLTTPDQTTGLPLGSVTGAGSSALSSPISAPSSAGASLPGAPSSGG